MKKVVARLTTYERLTKDSKRKVKIEKEYKQLLFSELLIMGKTGKKTK